MPRFKSNAQVAAEKAALLDAPPPPDDVPVPEKKEPPPAKSGTPARKPGRLYCDSCRWWDPRAEKDWGYCHRSLVTLPAGNQLSPLGLRGLYLTSAAGDWCAAHQPESGPS